MANKQNKKTAAKPIARNNITEQIAGEAKTKFPVYLKLAFLLGLISIAVYANTLKNGFVLDDGAVITGNSLVTKGISGIPEILHTPYHHGQFKNTSNDLYRPLSLVMFATEYQVFKTNPLPYHLINILLFAGCIILLFYFLHSLFERKKTAVAFIASLMFALHPIHTEVVANIKSQDELMCFFFAFFSLNIFIKYISSGKAAQLLLGAFCYFLAFLSKETVVTYLAVIPLVFFFYRNENKKRSIYISAATTLVAIICIVIRLSVLNYYHANEIANINFMDNALAKRDLSFDSRIATAILILGYYIKLLVFPYPLICDYSYNSIPYAHFTDPAVLISLALYIFLAVFSVKRLLKNNKDPYAFSILFFLITISLFTNIPFLIGTTMGERLMFFPSLGFCMSIAFLIEKFAKEAKGAAVTILRNNKVLATVIPICLIYSFLTITRNSEWEDSSTLFKTDVKKAPEDSKLNLDAGEMTENSNYAETDTVKKRQIIIESISYLRKAIEIYPDYALPNLDLGWAYNLVNKYDSAELFEKRATELEQRNEVAFNDLATIYNNEKKYPQAIESFKKVVQINPDFDGAESGMGDAFFYNGQYDSAEVHEQLAIKLNPKNTDAINDLAGVYFFRKKYPQAIELYKNAATLNPNYVKLYTNIGICYLYTGKNDSAIYYANRGIMIDPSFNSSYEVLAAIYNTMNKADSARKYEAIAQKNNPGFKL